MSTPILISKLVKKKADDIIWLNVILPEAEAGSLIQFIVIKALNAE